MINFKTNVTCEYKDLIKSGKNRRSNHSDIHIYKLFLPDYYDIIDELNSFLNSKERERAQNYYQEKDKIRFIICRAFLKFMLSIYTKSDVKKIKLNFNPSKKPYLSSHPQIFFNVSHSNDYGLIGISDRPIGVDVEYIEENNDLINSLEDIYSDKEIAFVQNAFDKKEAFYSLWTRKEAFVKAIGKGINDDFSKIPSINGSHILDTSLSKNTNKWKIVGFKIDDDYISAVAYEIQQSNTLSIFTLPNNMKNLKKSLTDYIYKL